MAAPKTPLRFDNPARDTFLASVADPAFAVPTLDEFARLSGDERAAGERARALLNTYAESRSLADLAAIPLRGAEKPVLWRVRAINAEQRALVNSNRLPALADLDAARFGVVARVEGATVTPEGTVTGGTETKLAQTEGARLPTITDAAIDGETSLAGGTWVDEMGAAIRHRSDQHPRRCLPFPLPQRVAALL
jgi:hypothetical protein